MVEDDPSLGASSISCLYSQISPKSLAGTFIYNSSHADPLQITLDEAISTIIHEIFHSVFFDFVLFERFPKNSKGEDSLFLDSNGVYRLRSDTFLELTKQHFKCIFYFLTEFFELIIIGNLIKDVPLENDGGEESEGSHFERFLFGNELMTPENPGITIISIFSLAVLKDFGVYAVDLNQAEEFYWGRNTGCQFFFNFCSSNKSNIRV